MNVALVTILNSNDKFTLEHYLWHKKLGVTFFYYIDKSNDKENFELLNYLANEDCHFHNLNSINVKNVGFSLQSLSLIFDYFGKNKRIDYFMLTSIDEYFSLKKYPSFKELLCKYNKANVLQLSVQSNLNIERQNIDVKTLGKYSHTNYKFIWKNQSQLKLISFDFDSLSIETGKEVIYLPNSVASLLKYNSNNFYQLFLNESLPLLNKNFTERKRIISAKHQYLLKNKTNLKVAVCFFGITRSLNYTVDSIKKNILDPLSSIHDFQINAHYYDINHVSSSRSNENVAVDKNQFRALQHDSLLLEKVKSIDEYCDFELIKNFGDAWDNNFSSLNNLILQLNSLKNVTNMALSKGADICVFIRPDLTYYDNFNEVLINSIASYNDNRADRVYLPNWQHFGGLNDRFAICSGQKAIKAYGKRLDKVIYYCVKTGRALHSERLVKFSLQQDSIPLEFVSLKASRTRADGKVVNESFLDRKSLK